MSQTEIQLVRLQRNGVKVEVLGRPGMVTKYRDGKCALSDAVHDDRIFANASKGDLASDADLAKLGCRGQALLELILKTGQYGITAAERREMVERRRAEVVNYIHDNFVDSTTGRPHPVVRIEAALAEVKASFDPDADAERIANGLLSKLQSIIRLQKKIIEGTVRVPVARLGQVIGICYALADVGQQEYGTEFAYVEIAVTPGKYDQLVEQLGKASAGTAVFEIKGSAASVEGAKEATAAVTQPDKGGKKRRRGK
jgi:rRNA metabolism SBDS family protein